MVESNLTAQTSCSGREGVGAGDANEGSFSVRREKNIDGARESNHFTRDRKSMTWYSLQSELISRGRE